MFLADALGNRFVVTRVFGFWQGPRKLSWGGKLRPEFRGPKGRVLRPEGPKSKALRAESGVGFLGRSSEPLPTS